MRPVHRGDCPTNSAGKAVIFEEYGYARPHLTGRMGDYCSFCEMPVASGLAVEHIRHKDNNGDLECEWTNFLLACHSCNSYKGTKIDTQADVDAHLWPHLHRTFDVFEYRNGIVKLTAIGDPELAKRAEATEAMVQLKRRPGAGITREQALRDSDRRWRKRELAWDDAIKAREDLRQCDTPQMRAQIVRSARGTGFWSVWMTVFEDDTDMRHRFCTEAFVGTAMERVF
ncbi:MAG TPA: HNH endonuclease [Polyangium sp.]|nr:HNH endonuclease [Polyangium sp.]